MKENSSESGRQFYIPIILTLITVVLGMISFHAVFPDYPFFRKLYYTFQLFSMESGDRFYENGSQPLPVTLIFNIARFTAVAAIFATIVLAILSAMKYKFNQMRLFWIKGHTIICGLGNMGLAIAEKIHNKRKLVIIERDSSNEHLEKLQHAGAIIVKENARDVSVLNKVRFRHARCLVALTGNDFDNLTIIKHVIDTKKDDSPSKATLSLIANIDSRNLKTSVTDEWQTGRVTSEPGLRKTLNIYYKKSCDVLSGKISGNDISGLKEELIILKKWLKNYDPATDTCRNIMENVILFNKNQLAARYIFLNYPPDRFRTITMPDEKALEILILGFSHIGEELLRLFVQNCHYLTREKTKITLACLDGEVIEERTLSKYPTLRQIIDFRCIKQNPHHLTRHLLEHNEISAVDVIYICSGEDRFQASYSSRAKELFGNHIPIVRPFYQTFVLSEKEADRNIWSFNVLAKISELEYIIDKKPDKKAMAIHNHWLRTEIDKYLEEVDKFLESYDKFLKETPGIPVPKPTLEPWNLLPGEIRDDNRSVVDHINIKLRSFGQLTDPRHYGDPNESDINYSFLNDPVKLTQLAEMEHRRWMANKNLCGWEYGEKRDVKAKKHENMTDFEKLDKTVRDIDIRQIKELKEIIELD